MFSRNFFRLKECCNSALLGLYYCNGLLAKGTVSYLAEGLRSIVLIESLKAFCTLFLSLLPLLSGSLLNAFDFAIHFRVMHNFFTECCKFLSMSCAPLLSVHLLLGKVCFPLFKVCRLVVELWGFKWLVDLSYKLFDLFLIVGAQFLWRHC